MAIIVYANCQDWARNHSGDPEVEASLQRGEDPGLALVSFQSAASVISCKITNKYIIFLMLV